MLKKILLLEDNLESAGYLKEIIEKEIPDIQVLQSKTYEEACEIINTHPLDLLILDVHLGESEKSGIDFAEYYRKSPDNTLTWIVFLSEYRDYVHEALNRSHCYDYISKPVDTNRLLSMIKELLDRRIVEESSSLFLCLKQKNATLKVPMTDINYIEMLNKHCIIHMNNRVHDIPRVPLKAIIKQLPPKVFIQCHKSFIVNINNAEGICHSTHGCSIVISGINEQVPVGNTYKATILEIFDKAYSRRKKEEVV